MSEKENLACVERIFNAINSKDLDSTDDYYAPGYQFEGPGAPGAIDLDRSKEYVRGFLTAFPDLHFKLTTKVAQGDSVAVSWASSGTHTGPLGTPTGDTIPPTNKKTTVTGSSFYEFRNGKIINSQIYWDMASLLAQIGMMPGM